MSRNAEWIVLNCNQKGCFQWKYTWSDLFFFPRSFSSLLKKQPLKRRSSAPRAIRQMFDARLKSPRAHLHTDAPCVGLMGRERRRVESRWWLMTRLARIFTVIPGIWWQSKIDTRAHTNLLFTHNYYTLLFYRQQSLFIIVHNLANYLLVGTLSALSSSSDCILSTPLDGADSSLQDSSLFLMDLAVSSGLYYDLEWLRE